MKTVVITGSTRGLGLELAKQFRGKNCNLVICGTKQENIDKAVRTLNDINAKGEVLGFKCNVAVLQEVEMLAQAAVEKFGRIDIWINNAGINQSFQYAWEVSEEEIDGLLGVDLKGTINGSGVAVRQMMKQDLGAIYNVEGMGSNDALQSCFALYGTAKRAVTYYTDALAHEIAEKDLPILVGKLSPGIMITDFLTSAKGQQNQTVLNDKTKKVYNILGDYPDVVAEFLVKEIVKDVNSEAQKLQKSGKKADGRKSGGKKSGKGAKRIAWLTGSKAAVRFMTAGFHKRDFFA